MSADSAGAASGEHAEADGAMEFEGATSDSIALMRGGLLAAARRGDPQAWRSIVGLYGRRVFALAKSRVRDADVAEEIAQSVFATVSAKLIERDGGEAVGYAEQGKFEPWLFRVTMNRVRDYVRREKRRPVVRDEAALANTPARDGRDNGAPGARAAADNAAMIGTLRLAMEDLSDADREVIELRHHGGLSFSQMAEMLEEPLGTLLARHHRALKKLREILETKHKVVLNTRIGDHA